LVDHFVAEALAPWPVVIDLNLEGPIYTPQPPVRCINMTPGLGKTTAVLARLVPAMLAAGKVVHIYIPRHDLGRQQRDFLAATGIDSRVYQSRGADDLEKPGQTMCLEIERTSAISDALGEVDTLACKSAKGVCQFYEGDGGCGYQGQLRDPPRVWIIPINNLFLPLPSRIPKPDIVVIDEHFHDACLEDDVVLEINDIIHNRVWPKAKTEDQEIKRANAEADLRAISQKVYMVLHEQLSQQARCRARRDWFDDVITAKDAKEAHRLEWARKLPIDDVFPGMPSEQAVERALLCAQHNQLVDRLCKFWKKLALTLEHDWDLSLYLSIDRECTIPFSEHTAPAVTIASRMELREGVSNCPTLHIDGTMVPLIVQQFYPYATFHQIAVKTPSFLTVSVVQQTDRVISKSSNSKLIVEECRRLIETEARATNGIVGVITLSYIEAELNKGRPLPGNVKIAHYGNITGLNDMAEVSTIILVGRLEPRPINLEKTARLMFKREVQGIEGYYPKMQRLLAIRDSTEVVSVEGTFHPDPGVEALRWLAHEGETIQAYHRARPINRTAANPLRAVIASNSCLPIEVDQVTSWDGMQPCLFETMIAMGGAVPSSYGDMADAYPALFPTAEAARADHARERGRLYGVTSLLVSFKGNDTISGRRWVLVKPAGPYREVTPFKAIKYRRAGAPGRAPTLMFDPDRVPDPIAWLRERLGCEVVLVDTL
jgi:hypothetical protein